MQWKYLIGCALATSQVNALQFSCSQLVIERFNPWAILSVGSISMLMSIIQASHVNSQIYERNSPR